MNGRRQGSEMEWVVDVFVVVFSAAIFRFP